MNQISHNNEPIMFLRDLQTELGIFELTESCDRLKLLLHKHNKEGVNVQKITEELSELLHEANVLKEKIDHAILTGALCECGKYLKRDCENGR